MRPAEFGKREGHISLSSPMLPTTSTPYAPGTWAGHPVVRNIARTYGKTVPDIAKDERGSTPVAQQPIPPTQPQQPAQAPQQPPPQAPEVPALAKQARVASTLNSSYNSLMNQARMRKIAATLRK